MIRSAFAFALLPAARFAIADPPTTAPAPLLEQISRETQTLVQSVRPGLVRVELPPPHWIQPFGDESSLMQKWGGRLDPDVLARLHEAQMGAAAGHGSNVGAFVPSTEPSIASSQPIEPSAQAPAQPPPRTFILARPDGGFELITSGAPPYDADIGSPPAPQILGIILDDGGHVLIPIFVEKEALEGHPLAVITADNKRIRADFVGSDRQTNLTIIHLESPPGSTPVGKPVGLSGDRPPDGALVLLLSPNGESGHLSIWTGGEQDRGLLITTAGQVGGFVRMGQFLSGDAMRPIADELIQDGKVRRAHLGVLISQSETPDGHRAMRIEEVVENSAAAAAGLRQGDFILSLANSPVGDIPTFAATIAQCDGPTDMQILRDGQSFTVTASLKPQ